MINDILTTYSWLHLAGSVRPAFSVCIQRLTDVFSHLTAFLLLLCRVGNALLLVSVIVGAITGAISLLFVQFTDWFDEAGEGDKAIAFLLGFAIGLAICSILLSTVASGVNAVIVMFADAPAELQQNYPDISQKMRDTWSQVYPGSV